MTELVGSDSLTTLGQIRSDARKKRGSNLFKSSPECRRNPIPPSCSEECGYVFTEQMLEFTPFAKIFASGPEDPLKHRHRFYCMICDRNISMKSRGLYELKRHFQGEQHFRVDQRFRARYHPTKVPGSDDRTLYWSKLEPEKDLFMHLDVPDLEHKLPFYNDVAEGKSFAFTAGNARDSLQIDLMMIFLRRGAHFWTLKEYWTREPALTGHSANTADYNWSEAYISVS